MRIITGIEHIWEPKADIILMRKHLDHDFHSYEIFISYRSNVNLIGTEIVI